LYQGWKFLSNDFSSSEIKFLFMLAKQKISYALILVCFTLVGFTQNQIVTGKVLAENSSIGIPGVVILEKGSSNSVVTASGGDYSINVSPNATLIFSILGYQTKEKSAPFNFPLNVLLVRDFPAAELLPVGYGHVSDSNRSRAITILSKTDFNQGNIYAATQLWQGKVAGLSIYNRGGDPFALLNIRIRGISTFEPNSIPLIVIDGVLGASLDNVDPNDIESISLLKDGSAAAIYGIRGSGGAILVTTKRGSSKPGDVSIAYNGYVAVAEVLDRWPSLSASEYVAAGGNNLGSVTDWQKEVTRTGVSDVHTIAISGGNERTTFRVSTNFRNINGILKKSGFDQLNARANFTHSALNDKLRIESSISMTTRNNSFSFNEALRYSVIFNPTAPMQFPSGAYYQAIQFDNYNPVSILELNSNEGKKKNLNYNLKADYKISSHLSVTAAFAHEYENNLTDEYYSRDSFFRGLDRGGLARRYTLDRSFSLFESFATYSRQSANTNLSAVIGYSYQTDNLEDLFISLGNFPNDQLGFNALQYAGDRLSGNPFLVDLKSSKTPENKIIATFARLNLAHKNGLSLHASVRREGSSKLGADIQYGYFPAVGLGLDINRYLRLSQFDFLKFRLGYGVTGSLPKSSGLSQDLYNYSFANGGSVQLARNGNPELLWEEKSEINAGIDIGLSSRFSATIDVYSRNIKDLILLRSVDPTVYQSGQRYENAASIKTKGIEFALYYDAINFGQIRWATGIVATSYRTTLESFPLNEELRASPGVPGCGCSTLLIRNKVGEAIGDMWGPVFDGVNADGTPRFKDLNGDGIVNPGNSGLSPADVQVLGNGLPSLELGWSNQLQFKNWSLNAFFRGAFGHSLVNDFRLSFEPENSGLINSYNRIKTNKTVSGLASSQYSSLYVESAGFLKLDNITLSYTIKALSSSVVKNLRMYTTIQNAFVVTNYAGIDPEPVLEDPGTYDNGGFLRAADVLAPGIDRRNSYFPSRTFTVGLSIGL
jgi:iron complex outermembrane receptor protein